MTKREICERLFGVIGLIDNSHDELLRAGLNVVMPYTMAKEMLQKLVLDIAASEESPGPVILCNEDRRDFFTDAGTPKREEKPKEEEQKSEETEAVKGMPRCPKCGRDAIAPGGHRYEWWCGTHGSFFAYPNEKPKSEEKPKVETSYKCPTCGFSPISKVGRDIWCPKCEMAYECEQHTETENDKL